MCPSSQPFGEGTTSLLSKVVTAFYLNMRPTLGHLVKTSQFSEQLNFHHFILTSEQPRRWGGWNGSPFSWWENWGSMATIICPESQSQPAAVAQHLAGLRRAMFLVACCFFTYPLYPGKSQKEAVYVLEMEDHTLNWRSCNKLSWIELNWRPYNELKEFLPRRLGWTPANLPTPECTFIYFLCFCP